MLCPKCGSDDLRLKDYDSYTNEFVYECCYCGSIIRRFNNETITTNKTKSTNTNKSITVNKSIEDNKQQYK